MALAKCMNCGENFQPEHSRLDHVCDPCHKFVPDDDCHEPEYRYCNDCGDELDPGESRTCSMCSRDL